MAEGRTWVIKGVSDETRDARGACGGADRRRVIDRELARAAALLAGCSVARAGRSDAAVWRGRDRHGRRYLELRPG